MKENVQTCSYMRSVCEIDNAITQFAFKMTKSTFQHEKPMLLVRFVQIITGSALAGKKL